MPSAVATRRMLFLLLASSIASLSIATFEVFAEVPAAPTASTDVAARVDGLIAQLSSDDWPRRQEAEEQLVQLAADAVPRLREVAESAADAEVRTRCESALHRIARNERVGPTIVTLHLANATPREAFEALAQASGAALRAHPPTLWDHHGGAAQVTLDVDGEPFWEAARRLSAETALELRPSNDELRVANMSDRRLRGPSTVSGPLLIIANSISRASSIDLGTGATTSDFSIMLTVLPEPKLRVLRTWSNVRIEQAVDENGASLVPEVVHPDSHSIPRQTTWAAVARLTYPPAAGKRIALLRGSLLFTAQTQSETFEIRDLLSARNVRHELDAGVVTVRSCRQIGNQYELVLVLSRSALAGAAPWDQFRHALLPGLRVLDAEDRPLQRGPLSTSGTEESLEFTVRFTAAAVPPAVGRAGPPARLVWDIPTESREIAAPFEFSDLPMP